MGTSHEVANTTTVVIELLRTKTYQFALGRTVFVRATFEALATSIHTSITTAWTFCGVIAFERFGAVFLRILTSAGDAFLVGITLFVGLTARIGIDKPAITVTPQIAQAETNEHKR